jgi:hypothetical protein
MELLAQLAAVLALHLAWAILSNSFFNQVFGFSLSLFLLLLASLIYCQPTPIETYFQIVLALSLAVFCVRLLPLVQWLLGSRSLNPRHREDLEVFPSKDNGPGGGGDPQRPFRAEYVSPCTIWWSILC